jgi:hypothetical protein
LTEEDFPAPPRRPPTPPPIIQEPSIAESLGAALSPASEFFPSDFHPESSNPLPETDPFLLTFTNPDEENDMAAAAPIAPPLPREVKIHPPVEFIGEPTKTAKFIQECGLYLHVNPTIYDTDEKRIIFALSYMTGGTATAWKEAFTDNAMRTNNFGTWAQFKAELRAAFSPIDEAGTARTKIKNLKQSSCDSLEDYIAKFRILKGKTGIVSV